MSNNPEHLNDQIYSEQAVDAIDVYRQRVNSIQADPELSETEREELLITAARQKEVKLRSEGFSELQLVWAWFANSSEDEWAEPNWSATQ